MDEVSLRKTVDLIKLCSPGSLDFGGSLTHHPSLGVSLKMIPQKRPSPEFFYTPGNGWDPYLGLGGKFGTVSSEMMLQTCKLQPEWC